MGTARRRRASLLPFEEEEDESSSSSSDEDESSVSSPCRLRMARRSSDDKWASDICVERGSEKKGEPDPGILGIALIGSDACGMPLMARALEPLC